MGHPVFVVYVLNNSESCDNKFFFSILIEVGISKNIVCIIGIIEVIFLEVAVQMYLILHLLDSRRANL